MPKSITSLAQKLLKGKEDGLEMLQMHKFPDDESAHDDELTERLYVEFSASVKGLTAELSKEYGTPSQTGNELVSNMPLNGVFRYTIWKVGSKRLILAAAHEDRGLPILLFLGTDDATVA